VHRRANLNDRRGDIVLDCSTCMHLRNLLDFQKNQGQESLAEHLMLSGSDFVSWRLHLAGRTLVSSRRLCTLWRAASLASHRAQEYDKQIQGYR
jgi:hypothetical protein